MRRLYTRRDFFAFLAGGALAAARPSPSASRIPRVKNRVVTFRRGGIERRDPAALGALLDGAVVEATGAPTASDAWLSLFSDRDHVSIKVNCLGGPAISTNPSLVRAVVRRLRNCGVKERNIIIWDRLSRELGEAGFELSRGGGGVQCYGTDEAGYERSIREKGSVGSLFSRILTERCSKIVNMPVLKDHGVCGVTFALKNYFGAIHNPNKYHLNGCDPYIGDLNSMRCIRDKEVLIIGDLTRVQADGGPGYKSRWAVPYGGVMIGRDPVAVDSAALGILEKLRRELDRPSLESKKLRPSYIRTAAGLGVGVREGFDHIERTM